MQAVRGGLWVCFSTPEVDPVWEWCRLCLVEVVVVVVDVVAPRCEVVVVVVQVVVDAAVRLDFEP